MCNCRNYKLWKTETEGYDCSGWSNQSECDLAAFCEWKQWNNNNGTCQLYKAQITINNLKELDDFGKDRDECNRRPIIESVTAVTFGTFIFLFIIFIFSFYYFKFNTRRTERATLIEGNL